MTAEIRIHPAVFQHGFDEAMKITHRMETSTGLVCLVKRGKACLVPKPAGIKRRDDWTPPGTAA